MNWNDKKEIELSRDKSRLNLSIHNITNRA